MTDTIMTFAIAIMITLIIVAGAAGIYYAKDDDCSTQHHVTKELRYE